MLANNRARVKLESNPDMTKKEYKRVKSQELAKARVEVGADGKNSRIVVDDKEWEAIQKGAISSTMLEKILAHSDADTLRAKATPRTTTVLTGAKLTKIKNMSNSGYTIAEIAAALGVSTSTVTKAMKEE